MTDRRTLLFGLLGLDGLIAMVVGSFLPWLRSGESHRNLYQASGALRRLGSVNGIAEFALRIAPYLGIGCGLVVAIYVLASTRLAAGLAALVAAAMAAGAIGAMRADGVASVQPQDVGPVVCLCGAVVVIIAVTLLLAGTRTAPDIGSNQP